MRQTTVLRVLGLMGLVDGLFLALNPTAWARWWEPWLTRIGERPVVARLTAVAELAIGLYFIWLSVPARHRALERLVFRARH
jgi:hypothetical protein